MTGRSTLSRVTLPLNIAESAFQKVVIDLALLNGWRVAHHLPARTARGWATATQGHVGVPDLILARDGVVLLAELKTQRGVVRPEQKTWLTALGGYGRLWRPSDIEAIRDELRRPIAAGLSGSPNNIKGERP